DVAGDTRGRCSGRGPAFAAPPGSAAWNGWSPALDNTHFQDARAAGLTADQVPNLKLKWAFGFQDAASAWSQATIVGGRVFVGGQNGIVYSLEAKSGCILWTFAAHAGVRTAITIGARAAFFGDQAGTVYAVEAATGRPLWTRKVDEHPLVRLTG